MACWEAEAAIKQLYKLNNPILEDRWPLTSMRLLDKKNVNK